jgi:hypothetical protein
LLVNPSTQFVHTIRPTQRLVHSIFHACQGQCLVSNVQAIHPTLMDRVLPASMIVRNVEMSSTRQIQWTTAWHALPNAVLSNTNQCNALRPQTEGVELAFRPTVAKMQEIPVSCIAKRISSSSFITRLTRGSLSQAKNPLRVQCQVRTPREGVDNATLRFCHPIVHTSLHVTGRTACGTAILDTLPVARSQVYKHSLVQWTPRISAV